MTTPRTREAAIDEVTAVQTFQAGDTVPFTAWADTLVASAAAAHGCTAARIGLEGAPFEPAVAVTFAGEAELDAWLDSAERAQVLRAGRTAGWLPSAPVIALASGGPAASGVSAFEHRVVADRRADFVRSQQGLADAARSFSGYEGTSLFVDDAGGALSVLRFRSDRHLASWLQSRQREAALPGLRSSLSTEFAAVSGTTGFGTTVRTEGGRMLMTPNWKSVLMVMLVLYPTVMLLSRFLGPVLDGLGAEPWLSLWLSQVVSVVLMQWWLMPWASKPFRRWLDPVDGAGLRSSLAGAVVILLLCAATLLLFDSVRWLQFWDYATP